MARFIMIGKLSPVKDIGKLMYFDERKFDTWSQRTLKLNMRCDTNSFILTSRGGNFEKIYLFEDKGGQSFQINWNQRFDSDVIQRCAEWKKYIVDLSERGYLKALVDYKTALNNGAVENFKSRFKDRLVGKTDSEIDEMIESERKKRKEFLTSWDFLEFLKKVVDSGKFTESNFYVTGNIEFSYDHKNKRWYQNYEPTRVYLTSEEPRSEAMVEMFYDRDSLDDTTAGEGYYTVRGGIQVYERQLKENVYAPYEVVIKSDSDDEIAVKKLKHQISRFQNIKDNEVFKLGMNIKLLNGSQRIELTEDDLTEEQKISLLFGEIEWSDIYAELGRTTWGERVTQNVFIKPSRGYTTGRQETILTPEMLDISYFLNKNIEEASFDDDDEESLFDDDDDLFA